MPKDVRKVKEIFKFFRGTIGGKFGKTLPAWLTVQKYYKCTYNKLKKSKSYIVLKTFQNMKYYLYMT